MPKLPAGRAPHSVSEIFRRKNLAFLWGFDIPIDTRYNNRDWQRKQKRK